MTAWDVGSDWARWDVHIHTPDTLLNNGFKGEWTDFLAKIAARPEVKALGVTDYFGIRGYERVRREIENGALRNVEFAFPNIEFRTGPATKKNSAINIHILVDPSTGDHVDRILTALSQLTFTYRDQPYACTTEGLRELGAVMDPDAKSDERREVAGANCFRPDFSEFTTWYKKQKWLKDNSLIAVSGGEDGPSGIKDDGWKATREEIFRFADIVFSPNENNRRFWLGLGQATEEELRVRLRGLKPCLHGSDAHDLDGILEPPERRYCWIKGKRSFDGLRQVLYEPSERVRIAARPPASPARSIVKLSVSGAEEWLSPSVIELNSGLVTVIGPRGSGKTALADLIASASEALTEGTDASFLYKAEPFLADVKAELKWNTGERSEAIAVLNNGAHESGIRYLSQQFVETLCSNDTAALQREIEDVVFSRLDEAEHGDALNFRDLRSDLTHPLQDARDSARVEIEEATLELEQLRDDMAAAQANKRRLQQLPNELNGVQRAIEQRTSSSDEKTKTRYDELSQELQRIRHEVAGVQQQQQAVQRLERSLEQFEQELQSWANRIGSEWQSAGLPPDKLKAVMPTLDQSYAGVLEERRGGLRERQQQLRGSAESPANPASRTLVQVQRELEQVAKLIEKDEKRRKELEDLRESLVAKRSELKTLRESLDSFEANEASRRSVAESARTDAYVRIIGTFAEEIEILQDLYRPLQSHLAQMQEHESSLEFRVRCRVRVKEWVADGERLFDLRKASFARQDESLMGLAQDHLVAAWSECSIDSAREGISAVLQELRTDIRDARRTDVSLTDVANWLFSTQHLHLEYELRYEGRALPQLSPGTKGIALLVLYLAVDQDDTRPLVIDQPEENLDPRSVYTKLVPYFRAAKNRRQVILVTHNPNLVVNTDSDQVIVADASPQAEDRLPRISYVSGALEDFDTRSAVCKIVEGGESAFRERERKYRIPDPSKHPRET
ncbi:MAG: TrlF family AAA-like ATPase [Myxococcota bacterium]